MYNNFLNCQLFAARFLCFFLTMAAILHFLVVETLDIAGIWTMCTRVLATLQGLAIQLPQAHPYPDDAEQHDERHYPVLPVAHHNNDPI